MELDAKEILLKVNNTDISTDISCNKDKISQVIRNLLSNAVRYSPPHKQINISFAIAQLPSGRRDDDKKEIPALLIQIKDEGIGIPDEELNSIFDKYEC